MAPRSSGGSTASGGTTGSSATSSWGTSADVGEELGDVLTFKGLGEESGPVALNGVTAGLDDLAEFLLLFISKKLLMSLHYGRVVTYRDFEVSVVEEECSVCANESVLFFSFESRWCNLSHFSYLIIY